ncbi:methylenetetrahydrofolate reductase-domain-containing protein [Gamsiella multidivaricata]|uniref:methylenetetrahydrofolate reductase-domain-containing protein n=1 Tax=Gamsiella multidivaricata TaxID=101098 RepID=UPI0022212B05|nr:methylenetetrahydrofolate reductase-domain-containing protein [Gamsiella multidivaricata]KAI7822591.1 methylenetetrahydrofolate reductase-domain-containing protein [Gamsiella multidivaricata]
MKIINKIAQKNAEGKPFYSFEYFPPKTAQGLSNLFDRIGRMQVLSPAFVTCTWGAGGSTFEKTTELSAVAQTVHGLETCMHLTCTNMDRGKVDDALAEAKKAGIQNILALRGDPPRGQEYWTQVDDTFVHAIDLVRYIRQQYGDYFCIGVAGYPEGHMDNTSFSSEEEIKFLKEKIDAGADFVLTQLFYDVDGFLAWEKQCRALGIVCPIIPGVMPIQSYNGFRRITNLAKIRIPEAIAQALEPIKNDDQKVKDYGVELAATIIDRLLSAGITGFHICTLNLEKSVRLILERVGFVSPSVTARKQQQQHINNEPTHVSVATKTSGAAGPESGESHLGPLIWKPIDDLLGRSESWDDFPNGRWGDARSPAFGDLDGYGASLKVEPRKALEMWRRPKSKEDISQLFVEFIQGRIPLLPWSEGSPLPETEAIRSRLVACNERGLWTVGSQPAVNGKPSTDPLVGWGPKGGYVYQKAFLELFVGPDEVAEMVNKLRTSSPWITFFVASRDGDVVTNSTGDVLEEQRKIAELKKICGEKLNEKTTSTGVDTSSSTADSTSTETPVCATSFANKTDDALVEGSNAVTWGVFPGKEIVQPTVIEKVSFLAWRDEAFEIWREWEHLYPKGSDSQKLLHQIGHDYWLLNVVHNDFRDENGIWDIVLS